MGARANRKRSALFLSCDLVGSTSFKQSAPGWQQIFLSFYREFPQALVVADRERAKTDSKTTEFRLWKAVGDELIFEVDVRDELEVSRAVRVWLDAIDEYEQRVLKDVSLALKGGAFIATFPGPDSESTIPRQPGTEKSDGSVVLMNDDALTGPRALSRYLFDYFGPSIDTGFRVFGLASQRYFTLSVEVAWAMAVAAHRESATRSNSGLHGMDDFSFLGAHILKGVWKAREYPIFAIDRQVSDPVNEAMAALMNSPLQAQRVINVCDACSNDPNWPFKLYLPDSTHPAFTVEPEDVMEELRRAATYLDGVDKVLAPEDGETPESVELG